MARTVLYLILIGKFYFLIIISGETRIMNLEMEPLYVKAGDPLQLVCEQTHGFKTTWLRLLRFNASGESSSNSYEPMSTADGFVENIFDKHGKHLNIIAKQISNPNDSGSYCCNVLNNLDSSYYVDVNVFQVTNKDGMMVNPGGITNIACQFISESRIYPEFSWHRDGKMIDPGRRSRKYFINSTWNDRHFISHLMIRKTYEHDIGTYECHLILSNNATFIHQVQLTSAPIVRIIERSVMVREHDTTKVICFVSGWPTPTTQWFKGLNNDSTISNKPLDIENGDRIYAEHQPNNPIISSLSSSSSLPPLSSPSSSSPPHPDQRNTSTELQPNQLPITSDFSNFRSKSGNSTLVIVDARLSDRDVYVCQASTIVNGSQILTARVNVLIRVKGRYACLYPLAGVILEFVVLIIIIITYERKKKRHSDDLTNTQDNILSQPLVRRSSSGKPMTRK